ncbi:MAG TPA: TAXI family TRAP transporter solute-binding subunit [Burkholderiales bacterium]|jgi:TRAP transporter TAXI family solute receptor
MNHAASGSRYTRLVISIAIVLAVAFVVALVLTLLGPAPPRTVVMATGPEGGAYHQLGERYRTLLEREGVELKILTTDGAVDNVQRLRDARSGVSVAFVQGGVTSEQESPELVSLGTVFYEPVWLFVRGGTPRFRPDLFKGRRVSIGPEGSGTRKLAVELMGAVGLSLDGVETLPLTGSAVAEAMPRGDVDFAVLVASWESKAVRDLLTADGVTALSFPRADAHVVLRPYLSKLVVPQGVADLARNRPPTDLVLVAPKASLVARRDLHPAIAYLLLDVASQLHSHPGIFQKAGEFPAAEPIDLPLSADARQFYQSGRPFLQRYLPFWVAVFAARLLVILIPVVGVVYPLARLAPAIYGWGMRRRIFTLYGELKFLETEIDARAGGKPMDDLRTGLDKLEQRANHMRVPVTFAHMLYTLRLHIRLVREHLERRIGASGEKPNGKE